VVREEEMKPKTKSAVLSIVLVVVLTALLVAMATSCVARDAGYHDFGEGWLVASGSHYEK